MTVMVYEDLFARLNEVGYKNWLKAGFCLLKVKDGLCGFADQEMRQFHQSVINNNSVLQSQHTCKKQCRPRATQVGDLHLYNSPTTFNTATHKSIQKNTINSLLIIRP